MGSKSKILVLIAALTLFGVALIGIISFSNPHYVTNANNKQVIESSPASLISDKESVTAEQLSQLPKSEEVAEDDAGISYQGDQIIVSFKEDAFDENTLNDYAKKVIAGVVSVDDSLVQKVDERTALLNVRSGASVSQAYEELASNDNISYSQPNYIYTLADTSEATDTNETADSNNVAVPSGVFDYTETNDPRASEQWAVATYTEPVRKAWTIQKGDGSNVTKPVTVAVLDTGVDSDHEDLKDNLVGAVGMTTTKYGELESDGEDVYFHGTHCAGIIAGVSNNNIGITGVSHNSKVYSIRIFKYDYWGGTYGLGCTSIEIANGIKEAINKKDEYNIRVISMSLGISGTSKSTGASLESLVKEQVNNATNNGISIVAASGNESKSSFQPVAFPAYLDNVIAVGACNQNGERCNFSNGSAELDVVAPGYSILSTTPMEQNWSHSSVSTGYSKLNGTSMATPYVAATVALMYSLNPDLTTTQVEEILRETADNSSGKFTNELGYGKCNPYNALLKVQQTVKAQTCTHENQTTKAKVEPTCVSKGKAEEIVCSDCGEHISGGEEIAVDSSKHTALVEVAEKKATCIEGGYNAHKHCNDCGADVDKVTTNANPDNHSDLVNVESKTKTCTTDGWSAYQHCNGCYLDIGKVLEIHEGHKMVEKDGTAVEATCSTQGKHADKECSVCHEVETGAAIECTPHDLITNITDATCTHAGEEITTCAHCDYRETKEIPMLNHDLETTTTHATCQDDGYETSKCKNCDYSLTTKIEDKVDHVYVDGHCQWCSSEESKTDQGDSGTDTGGDSGDSGTDTGGDSGDTGTDTGGGSQDKPDQKQDEPVKFQLNIKTSNSANVTLDKTQYKQGETAKLTIKGESSGDNIKIVKSVKVDGKVIKTQDQLINKSTWTSNNTVYKRVMGENVTSVEYDKVVKNLTSGVTVNVANISANTKVEVDFEELVPVYRLYNSITSEHLFTTDKVEYDNYVKLSKENKEYWIGEGINWFAPKTGESTVTRLYNPTLGALGRTSHYYTSDAAEIKELTTKHGWIDESAEGKTFASGGDIPIWTCYNEALGSAHHYTSSESEWRGLAKHGWDLEKSKNRTSGVFKATLSAVS